MFHVSNVSRFDQMDFNVNDRVIGKVGRNKNATGIITEIHHQKGFKIHVLWDLNSLKKLAGSTTIETKRGIQMLKDHEPFQVEGQHQLFPEFAEDIS